MANGIEIQTEALAADIRSMTEAVTQAERRTKEMFQLMSELDQMWDGPTGRFRPSSPPTTAGWKRCAGRYGT